MLPVASPFKSAERGETLDEHNAITIARTGRAEENARLGARLLQQSGFGSLALPPANGIQNKFARRGIRR
jgi:hypothetical protein